MTKGNFERVVNGLREVLDHVEGRDVPGMIIHTSEEIQSRWIARVSEIADEYEGANTSTDPADVTRHLLDSGVINFSMSHEEAAGIVAQTIASA